MDPEKLAQLISGMTSSNRKDEKPEGNYQDFLWAYMNALNHGAQQEEIDELTNAIPQDMGASMYNARDVGALDAPEFRKPKQDINNLLKQFIK